MRMNKSDPLLFDPEPKRTIPRRQSHEWLAQAITMEGNNNNSLDSEVEAWIEEAVQERLAQRLREREQHDANRSLRNQTAESMSYDYPGSIVYLNVEGDNFELRPAFISLVS